jgi:hypothetical protein
MNEQDDTREVILEWQVTTTMPQRWFDIYQEEDGVDIYDAIDMFLEDHDFETMMADGTFQSVAATNIGVSFRE